MILVLMSLLGKIGSNTHLYNPLMVLHVQHGVLLRLVLGLGIGDGRQGTSDGVRVSLVTTSEMAVCVVWYMCTECWCWC